MVSTTIEQFIKSKPDITMSYEFLSMYEVIDDIALISYNLLNDYYQELRDISAVVTLSDADMAIYKYNPKALCRYIYGSAELFFIILAINNMSSPKEFSKNKIRMIYQSDMENVVTYILNAEKNTKSLNEQKIKEA